MDNQELAATLLSTRAKFENAISDVDDLNTDFIALQKDVDALSDTVNGYDARITEAIQKADTAQNTANTAMSTADTALTHASEADDKAVSAQESATQAYDVAMAAQDQAQTAFTHASTAITDAEEAKTLAETKYEKPAGGIPESDLSQDVQTKLNAGGGAIYTHHIVCLITQTSLQIRVLFDVVLNTNDSLAGHHIQPLLSRIYNDTTEICCGGIVVGTTNMAMSIYSATAYKLGSGDYDLLVQYISRAGLSTQISINDDSADTIEIRDVVTS